MASEKASELDLVQAIYVKNHLLILPPDKLMEIYCNDERFIYFIDTLIVIANSDYGFFLFNDLILDRILSVINRRRNCYSDENTVEGINSLIRLCNYTKNLDSKVKQLYLTQYLMYQSDIRNFEIDSIRKMAVLTVNDAFVYDAVVHDEWSNISYDGFLLGSLMYLRKFTPSIFNDDIKRANVIERLNFIKDKNGIFNKQIKEYKKVVIDSISKLNKKEE